MHRSRYVAFVSSASKLVPHDHNDLPDAFVRDLVEGKTKRVIEGQVGNTIAMSGNGRYVANAFVRYDRVTGVTSPVAVGPRTTFAEVHGIRADGDVLFTTAGPRIVPGDTNRRTDVFIARY